MRPAQHPDQRQSASHVVRAQSSHSPNHIFGSATLCRSRTRALLLLLPLLPWLLPLLLLPLLPLPGLPLLPLPGLPLLLSTTATPSVGLIPSLSRSAGVMRER
jgi:hypothetical protein